MKASKIKMLMGLVVSVFVVWGIAWYYFSYIPFTPSPLSFFADIFVFATTFWLWGMFGEVGVYDE